MLEFPVEDLYINNFESADLRSQGYSNVGI